MAQIANSNWACLVLCQSQAPCFTFHFFVEGCSVNPKWQHDCLLCALCVDQSLTFNSYVIIKTTFGLKCLFRPCSTS